MVSWCHSTNRSMVFFRLDHPVYQTDQEAACANPVRDDSYALQVPCIECGACGAYSNSSVLRIPPPTDAETVEMLAGKILPADEWEWAVTKLARRLGVSPSRLSAGTDIGPPKGLILKADLPDFVHPLPGRMWVKRAVVDALKGIRATGIEYNAVELDWAQEVSSARPVPELWELTVTGVAWRTGRTTESNAKCPVCLRQHYARPWYWSIDESRWDGSDFANVDGARTVVAVTGHICNLFAQHRFSNYECLSEWQVRERY